MLVQTRARLDCGCCCFVGIRLDTNEVASATGACSVAHEQLVTHFNPLLRESPAEPDARPLVEVCDELLGQAKQYVAGGADAL
jgi:hypothetical protein